MVYSFKEADLPVRAGGSKARSENPWELRPPSALLSSIPTDLRFLHRFGIGLPTLRQAAENAAFHQISPAQALIRCGMMSEEDYYRCAAEELGLQFQAIVPADEEPLRVAPPIDVMERMAFMVPHHASKRFFIAPDMTKADDLRALLALMPSLSSRLIVTTRTQNLESLQTKARPGLLQRAISELRDGRPDMSAERVITSLQAVVLIVLAQLLAVATFFSSGTVLLVLHFAASLSFFACGSIRAFAAMMVTPRERQAEPLWQAAANFSDRDLPYYSVLVALYKEAGQVEPLVRCLARIDWPVEKLEIKLVCEADDAPTINAVRRLLANRNLPHIALVIVPVSLPRTKPKALNYALPLCKGRCLVVYDAEDRPERDQLRDAWRNFQTGGENLVCLQAPLIVHNHRQSWLSAMFTIEYCALFDGLLPALAKLRLPLPLGGTSNHFKRSALEKAGGWDPYNVTEDADLGMRLARLGYRTATIKTPTYEEAPTRFAVWRNQRTRWFKGWMQTWLVHMRHPIQMAKDLGLSGTLAFHFLITGMILSALVHPLLIYFLARAVLTSWQQGFSGVTGHPLFWFDVVTVTTGYLAFAALAWRTLPIRGLKRLRSLLIGLPLYWMLLSIAAWRALLHLIIRPHHWEKTPHGVSNPRENVSTVSDPAPDSLISDRTRKEPLVA